MGKLARLAVHLPLPAQVRAEAPASAAAGAGAASMPNPMAFAVPWTTCVSTFVGVTPMSECTAGRADPGSLGTSTPAKLFAASYMPGKCSPNVSGGK